MNLDKFTYDELIFFREIYVDLVKNIDKHLKEKCKEVPKTSINHYPDFWEHICEDIPKIKNIYFKKNRK